MKPLLVAAFALMTLVPGGAAAQVEVGRGENREADLAMRVADAEQFVGIAGNNDLFEIESSQIALERSQDEAIRAFAQTMLDEHTAMNGTLATTVKAADLPFALPAGIDAQSAQKMDDIRTITAGQFDEKYLRWQIQVAQVEVALFSGYKDNGDVDALKQYAAEALPMAEAHLAALLEINGARAQ